MINHLDFEYFVDKISISWKHFYFSPLIWNDFSLHRLIRKFIELKMDCFIYGEKKTFQVILEYCKCIVIAEAFHSSNERHRIYCCHVNDDNYDLLEKKLKSASMKKISQRYGLFFHPTFIHRFFVRIFSMSRECLTPKLLLAHIYHQAKVESPIIPVIKLKNL